MPPSTGEQNTPVIINFGYLVKSWLLRHCPFVREFTGPRWNPTQRPVARNFDVFLDLRWNKRLSKQSLGWWFETPDNQGRVCVSYQHIFIKLWIFNGIRRAHWWLHVGFVSVDKTILSDSPRPHDISWQHCNDVIMGAMASQITSLTVVYSTLYLGADQRKKTSKLRVTGLCAGNSSVTGEFPAQRASNAENVSIWWRHHVGNVLMDPIPTNALFSFWQVTPKIGCLGARQEVLQCVDHAELGWINKLCNLCDDITINQRGFQ